MFQVVWSSVVHAFWCFQGSVVNIFQPFLKGPYHYRIVVAFIPYILSTSISRSLYFESLLKGSFQWEWTYHWGGTFFLVCSWLQCRVCWPSSHDLSVLAYPTRLWCCLFLLLFGAHARTISRLCLYSSLCRCSSGGMWWLCCVCVGIQFWLAQGTLPQYGQQFPEFDNKSCTLGL